MHDFCLISFILSRLLCDRGSAMCLTKNLKIMTYYVYRVGVGPIFRSVPEMCVAEFGSWIEAHNYVTAQNEHWYGTYRFWMTGY